MPMIVYKEEEEEDEEVDEIEGNLDEEMSGYGSSTKAQLNR